MTAVGKQVSVGTEFGVGGWESHHNKARKHRNGILIRYMHSSWCEESNGVKKFIISSSRLILAQLFSHYAYFRIYYQETSLDSAICEADKNKWGRRVAKSQHCNVTPRRWDSVALVT